MLKMYIAVLDEVPDHMVPVLVAHSVLGAHLHMSIHDDDYNVDYFDWLLNSFRKVVLKVNRKEFIKIGGLPHKFFGHENTVLNGEPSCIVLCPREEWPNVIKFAKLWAPTTGKIEQW